MQRISPVVNIDQREMTDKLNRQKIIPVKKLRLPCLSLQYKYFIAFWKEEIIRVFKTVIPILVCTAHSTLRCTMLILRTSTALLLMLASALLVTAHDVDNERQRHSKLGLF